MVFATMALGMGVDFKSLDYIIHYGVPHSLENYIQESGRDHQLQSVFRIYWKPSEALLYTDQGVYCTNEGREYRALSQDYAAQVL